MIEVRGFNGKLNLDDNPYRLPNGDYSDALNITRDAEGKGQDEVVSNVVGNTEVPYTFEPSSTNKVIGNYADKVRNRQYNFVWNSDGYDEITYYDATANTIVKVIKNLTDTGGDNVLNFNIDYKINHIDIIYRDEEGDLLYWTDGLNPPRKINVKTATTGGYGTIISSYLDVAKEPPSAPPYCIYDNDLTIEVNNLNNKQFKFKYRFVFDDLEKSVTSAQSEIPIPVLYTESSISLNRNYNNNIVIVFQSGEKNVTRIEILGSESLGTTWSDFYLIDVINKSEEGINSNDVFVYKFYNDKSYNSISIIESIQPFDIVPQKAYTQSLPNGNVLDYGAITEGYDLPILSASASVDLLENYNYSGSILFLAYQDGQPALGEGDIKIICYGQFGVSGSVSINIDDNGTPITLTSTNISNSGTILFDIYTQAILAGFTIISYPLIGPLTGHLLIINKPNTSIISTINNATSIPYTVVGGPIYFFNKALNNNSQLAYNWNSQYGFGIVYFDEKGRTNGVVYNKDTFINTGRYYDNTVPFIGGSAILYNVSQPEITVTINSRPPIWANYYELVRTNCLNKSNFLYWISENTYKDDTPGADGFKYAYISLANLTAYITVNKEKKTLGYEFTPGDRIRFIKRYDLNGNTALNGNYTINDYEIVETLSTLKIDGITINGLLIKILLPTTSIDFDFGGNSYACYLIELYSPKLGFSAQNILYYEFGQKYIIGNPGTNQAFHQGLLQNQSEDLLTPAIIKSYKGDSYLRSRLIPTSGSVKWEFAPTPNISGTYFPMLASISYNSTHNSTYTPTDSTPTNGFLLDINTPTTPPAFFISGEIRLFYTANAFTPPYLEFYDGTSTQFWFNLYLGNANTSYTIQIPNSTIQTSIPYGWTKWGIRLRNFTGQLIYFDLTLTDGRNIYQTIVDSNFSDNYDSSALPNGRAWTYDPNAAQEFNPTLIRFGGEYQVGTTVNQTNRFYEENFDVYDRSRGNIKKMFIEGRNQYIFQQFDVGVVTVLTQIVKDTAGNPLSAESDRLLNKIVYPYVGGYGIGDMPESFAYGKSSKYFIDSNKGVVCRLAANGITPLSIVYKTNAFFVDKISTYKNDLPISPLSGKPVIYGAFDAYTNKYMIAMEEIIDITDPLDPIQVQQPYTISFLETRDNKEGFETFFDYYPENMGALNNLFITYKDGQLWKHDSPTFCNFYNSQKSASVTVIFNDAPLDKKSFLSIMETANTVWYCSDIKSQLNSYGSTPQSTYIVAARFALLEGQYYSAILRDANSPGGIINGDTMHGNYIMVTFKIDSASSFAYLNTVSLNYNNSPLNLR